MIFHNRHHTNEEIYSCLPFSRILCPVSFGHCTCKDFSSLWRHASWVYWPQSKVDLPTAWGGSPFQISLDFKVRCPLRFTHWHIVLRENRAYIGKFHKDPVEFNAPARHRQFIHPPGGIECCPSSKFLGRWPKPAVFTRCSTLLVASWVLNMTLAWSINTPLYCRRGKYMIFFCFLR